MNNFAYRICSNGNLVVKESPNLPDESDTVYTFCETLPIEIVNLKKEQDLKEHNHEIILEIKFKVKEILNSQAVSLGYDDINSIAKYLGYDNQYRLEAEKLGAWTALTWITLEAEQDRIIAEGAEINVENILALIPDYIA